MREVVAQEIAEEEDAVDVQAVEGLVGDHHRRRSEECADDADPPAHPLGQGGDGRVPGVVDPHGAQRVGQPGVAHGQAPHAPFEGDRLEGGHRGEEPAGLGEESHRRAGQAPPRVAAVEPDGSPGQRARAAQAVEERALARAVGAHDAQGLARSDAQGHGAHPAAVGVPVHQPLYLKHGAVLSGG